MSANHFCINCLSGLSPGSSVCPHCGFDSSAYDAPPHHLPPYTPLSGGRYVLGRSVGTGGFGITSLASDTRLGLPVAIKELFVSGKVRRENTHIDLLDKTGPGKRYYAQIKQRFIQEAMVLAEMEEAAEALYDSAQPAAQSSAEDVSYREDGAGTPGTEGQTESDTEQKLVYSANLSLQTLSYEETAKGIRDLVKKYKGIIESESESDSNWNWYRSSDSDPKMTLYLTIRIPTEHYEDFLAGLEGSGRVVSRNVWVDNITRSYYDQKAVLKGLELQEERLLSMMEKAETIEDMIAVEARLTEVQTQLNQARTKLSGMDFDVAYSTVNLSLEEVTRYVPQETSSSFLDRLKETCIDAGYTFLGALQSLLFAFIYLLPYAAALLILFLIVRFLYRRAKARRQKKNQ